MAGFIWSVKNGELIDVKNFVDKEGKDIVNTEYEGRYPLHYAADYGHTDVIEYLITKGAIIDQEDKHGICPLLAAVWEGHKSSVEMLLQKGADKNKTSPDGTSIVECAESEEIKKLLQ